MISIALVGGVRYMDMKSKTMFESGKSYPVSNDSAKRLLREKTRKGKFYFGRVEGDGTKESELVLSEDDVAKGTQPDEASPVVKGAGAKVSV